MRVLLTGMSGTGKSTVAAALRERGLVALDVDDCLTSLDPSDGRWHWDVPALRRRMAAEPGTVVVAGCSEEQSLLAWDRVVLLTAPVEVLLARLATRTGNDHGRTDAERAQVLDDVEHVEPLLRRRADVVLDTTAPLDDVVRAVLRALVA